MPHRHYYKLPGDDGPGALGCAALMIFTLFAMFAVAMIGIAVYHGLGGA